MFGRRTGAGAGGDGDSNPNKVDGRHHVGARIVQAPARVACRLGLGFRVTEASDSRHKEQPAVSGAGSTRLVAGGMVAASTGAADMYPTLYGRRPHAGMTVICMHSVKTLNHTATLARHRFRGATACLPPHMILALGFRV